MRITLVDKGSSGIALFSDIPGKIFNLVQICALFQSIQRLNLKILLSKKSLEFKGSRFFFNSGTINSERKSTSQSLFKDSQLFS